MPDNTQTHEHRIIALETAQEQTERRLNALERNHDDLKLTIMEENRDTRKFMQSLIERQIEAQGADEAREDEIRRERNAGIKDVVISIFGAGGIIALIIQFLMS